MQRIVLGYDASPVAERALERVMDLAKVTRSHVIVASVAPVYEYAIRGIGTHFEPADPPTLHSQMARDAVAKLTEQGLAAEPVTGVGHTAETLVELANARDADLIVVGASERDFVTRLFGGTSDDVAHEARCDVLVVH